MISKGPCEGSWSCMIEIKDIVQNIHIEKFVIIFNKNVTVFVSNKCMRLLSKTLKFIIIQNVDW